MYSRVVPGTWYMYASWCETERMSLHVHVFALVKYVNQSRVLAVVGGACPARLQRKSAAEGLLQIASKED